MEPYLEIWRNQGIDAARNAAIDNGWNMSVWDKSTGKIVNTWSDGKDRNTAVGSTQYVAPAPLFNTNNLGLYILVGAAALMLLKR